jgi:hypothetical protein
VWWVCFSVHFLPPLLRLWIGGVLISLSDCKGGISRFALNPKNLKPMNSVRPFAKLCYCIDRCLSVCLGVVSDMFFGLTMAELRGSVCRELLVSGVCILLIQKNL